MTLTTERAQDRETGTPTSTRPPTRPARAVLGWAAVITAIVAAAVLAVSVLTPGNATPTPQWSGDVKDHPLYRAAPVWSGDVKDHPLYRRPSAGQDAPRSTTPSSLSTAGG